MNYRTDIVNLLISKILLIGGMLLEGHLSESGSSLDHLW